MDGHYIYREADIAKSIAGHVNTPTSKWPIEQAEDQ